MDDCRKQKGKVFESFLNIFTLNNEGIDKGIKNGLVIIWFFDKRDIQLKSNVDIENYKAKLLKAICTFHIY